MINLYLAIYEGEPQLIYFNSFEELTEYIKFLKSFECIWLATDDGENGEIMITENLDALVIAINSGVFNFDPNNINFYLQEYQTYEDAYNVALLMREGFDLN